MEYYICQMYYEHLNNNAKNNIKTKKFQICILGLLLILGSIFSSLYVFSKSKCSMVISCIFYILTALVILCFMIQDEKSELENKMDTYQKNLAMLFGILSKYKLNTKDRIEQLILLYQNDINEFERESKIKYRKIKFLFTCISGVLALIIENKLKSNTSLILVSIIIALSCLILGSYIEYVADFNNITKQRYKLMIKHLNELCIFKFKNKH
ncbi:MAG: hypothetical protein UH654_03880 [Lachnospiraceae bacterium]|nr:hypothetical protein [Lachnospiraceae bacterium]